MLLFLQTIGSPVKISKVETDCYTSSLCDFCAGLMHILCVKNSMKLMTVTMKKV